MNLEKLENLLHAGVVLAFGVGLLVAFAPPARADAAADWVAYREANNLAVDPKPSLPGELPVGGGPVPDTLAAPLPEARANGNGNGNGHGAKRCELLAELAKSDGDVRGEDVRCED